MVQATSYATSGDSAIAKIGWDVSHGHHAQIQDLEDSSSIMWCVLKINLFDGNTFWEKHLVFWSRVGKCFPGIRLRKTWNNERTVLTLTSIKGLWNCMEHTWLWLALFQRHSVIHKRGKQINIVGPDAFRVSSRKSSTRSIAEDNEPLCDHASHHV